MGNKCYLGDSVYAEWIDGVIQLTTEDGYGNVSNTIYLEPEVFGNLREFVDEKFNSSSFCPKCGQSFVVHNDDGSCVED